MRKKERKKERKRRGEERRGEGTGLNWSRWHHWQNDV